MTASIQIVVPDVDGGVTDYALCLQAAFGPSVAEVVRVSSLNSESWQANGKNVLLQLSGYGFQRRGVPFWLLAAVKKRRRGMASFGVYFHELYAFGPPWRSSFYLSPAQRYLARRFAHLSDFWLTNRRESADWLTRVARPKRHAILSAVSNVGEPNSPPPEREPIVAIFGGALLRASTYRNARVLLERVASLGYQVHDIGPPVRDAATQSILRACRVIQHGRLAAEYVSAVLSKTQFGVLEYQPQYAAKSSVLAAYAAHGVCPILLSQTYPSADGLIPDNTYLTYQSALTHPELRSVQRTVGDSAWTWYQEHRIENHVSRYLSFIRGSQ